MSGRADLAGPRRRPRRRGGRRGRNGPRDGAGRGRRRGGPHDGAGGGRRYARSFTAALSVLALGGALVLAAATGGYPATRPRLLSGTAWLASSQVGQLTLLDGSSAEVAAQVQVGPRGNRLDVVQQASNAYAVDRTAGSLRRVDGATFALGPVVRPIPDAADGLTAFAGTDSVYALDTRRGVATDTDPHTLTARGRPLPLAAQVDPQAVTLDERGRLWVLDAGTGDLVWLDGGQRHTRRAATTSGGGMLTLAGGAPVLVDPQRRTASVLDPGSAATRSTVDLDLRPGERFTVSGSPHAARLYVVAARGVLAVCDLNVATCGTVVPLAAGSTDLGAAVETGNRVFVPDYSTGKVWIIDLHTGQIVAQPQVLSPQTHFQLLTRDGVVFFNDPESEHAGVIRLDGGVRSIAKYDPGSPDKGLAHGIDQPATGIVRARPPTGPVRPQPQPPTDPAPPANDDNPGINIAVTGTVAHVNEEIVLKVVGTGRAAPASAEWTFGDGQRATGLLTTHRWRSAQTYQVSATATFANGKTAIASLAIQVTNRPRLTVQAGPGGRVTGDGIDCPPTCAIPTDDGQHVTLTAQADTGFVFTGWGGACTGNGDCQVDVNADTTVSASFGSAVSVQVSAVNGTYSGPCPPPADATTYEATISVLTGPMTVRFRWGMGGGSSSDPSVQTVTFPGAGAQSQTVRHNERTFRDGQTVNDSVFVDLLSPVTMRSNRVAYRLTCVQPPPPAPPPPSPSPPPPPPLQVTGQLIAVSDRYDGPCPPPPNAIVFDAKISVNRGPITVTFHFEDSLIDETATFPGTGPQSKTVRHQVFPNTNNNAPGTRFFGQVFLVLDTPTLNTPADNARYSGMCT